MIASTVERVPAHTAEEVNERIRQQSHSNVERAVAGGPEAIRRRLRELNQEWDVERTLEANASTLVLAGTALGVLVDRRFLVVPAVVSAFLLQHAVQGWCPPLPAFRRLGFRTADEIFREREALESRLANAKG